MIPSLIKRHSLGFGATATAVIIGVVLCPLMVRKIINQYPIQISRMDGQKQWFILTMFYCVIPVKSIEQPVRLKARCSGYFFNIAGIDH